MMRYHKTYRSKNVLCAELAKHEGKATLIHVQNAPFVLNKKLNYLPSYHPQLYLMKLMSN